MFINDASKISASVSSVTSRPNVIWNNAAMRNDPPPLPISDHERNFVMSPNEVLKRQRERLAAEIDNTAQHLGDRHQEVAQIEERSDLLRADLDAAMQRLHLNPLQIAP
jgi:hypothetical protein